VSIQRIQDFQNLRDGSKIQRFFPLWCLPRFRYAVCLASSVNTYKTSTRFILSTNTRHFTQTKGFLVCSSEQNHEQDLCINEIKFVQLKCWSFWQALFSATNATVRAWRKEKGSRLCKNYRKNSAIFCPNQSSLQFTFWELAEQDGDTALMWQQERRSRNSLELSATSFVVADIVGDSIHDCIFTDRLLSH